MFGILNFLRVKKINSSVVGADPQFVFYRRSDCRKETGEFISHFLVDICRGKFVNAVILCCNPYITERIFCDRRAASDIWDSEGETPVFKVVSVDTGRGCGPHTFVAVLENCVDPH